MKSLSRVRLLVTPWTAAHQAPPSMGFSRQEYWSGLPFPSPGALPNTGIESRSPALQADALPSEPPGKPRKGLFKYLISNNRFGIDFHCVRSHPSFMTHFAFFQISQSKYSLSSDSSWRLEHNGVSGWNFCAFSDCNIFCFSVVISKLLRFPTHNWIISNFHPDFN